jgi:hypothetical protein
MRSFCLRGKTRDEEIITEGNKSSNVNVGFASCLAVLDLRLPGGILLITLRLNYRPAMRPVWRRNLVAIGVLMSLTLQLRFSRAGGRPHPDQRGRGRRRRLPRPLLPAARKAGAGRPGGAVLDDHLGQHSAPALPGRAAATDHGQRRQTCFNTGSQSSSFSRSAARHLRTRGSHLLFRAPGGGIEGGGFELKRQEDSNRKDAKCAKIVLL